MMAIKGDTGVCIAADFATAAFLSEGKYNGKSYRVWTGKYSATVAAECGDGACLMMTAALKSEGITVPATGLSFQAV